MSNSREHRVILIADDQAFIRSLLVSMLRGLGYGTLEATDGDHAMQQLARRPYAAILDHRMAGVTGLGILQAVRCGQTVLSRDLPVLMLTGHADEYVVRVAGELDVSALLTKPVSKAQLRARLDTATKRVSELKPPKSYAAVEVIPAEGSAAARHTSNAWILKNTILPQPATFVAAAKTARRAGTYRGDETHYSRIRPGMVLSKDLFSGGQRLLLAAGTELTEDTIKRLTGICEENPELTYLNVVPAEKARLYKS
jgi:CheY-like chemotaxis protein